MFRWLQQRIEEEKDRRQRQAAILALLPGAFKELERSLTACVETYNTAFGPEETIELHVLPGKIQILAGGRNGQWDGATQIEISAQPALPGFKVERGKQQPLTIEIGLLPGDKLFYRDGETFLNPEEMTRRILDRALFPKLED